MDLGSLELQIFVSLTVVLGGAFVALVCDYLKGNNEQLREYNIELRVRREEQERRALLDPAGTSGQSVVVGRAGAPTVVRPVSPEEMMQSFATAEALAAAEQRAARSHSRGGQASREELDVSPVTSRRVEKKQPKRRETSFATPVESPGISTPEVSQELPAEPAAQPEQMAGTTQLQTSVEQRQPGTPGASTILRPLTVPSLKLEEEIQRVAEQSGLRPEWNSPLLEEVIAASSTRSPELLAPEPEPAPEEVPVVLETPLEAPKLTFGEVLEAEPAVVVEVAQIPEAEPGLPLLETETKSEPEPQTVLQELPAVWLEPQEAQPEAVEQIPSDEIQHYYSFSPIPSRLAGMGLSPAAEYLPSIPQLEKPSAALSLLRDAEQPAGEQESAELPDLLPVYADLTWNPPPAAEEPSSLPAILEEPIAASPAPPPIWAEPVPALEIASPIDIDTLRQPEPAPEESFASPAATISALLLPTGMHDAATWARLLTLPNPMTGILFIISLQPGETKAKAQELGAPSPLVENASAIERLMASFVREGDFGTKISDTEWVFIYNHDVTGFNQRRVGMISEKLWDFQLRHLGMANVAFKWGAVEVAAEPVGEALQAARDRMNQTRRPRKLPGADSIMSRRVVNG